MFDVDPSGILGNMYELKTLIEDCLLRPYKDVHFAGLPEARVEHYMNEQGIPDDLKLFLWILQDPLTFVSSVSLRSYIRYRRFHSQYDLSCNSCIRPYSLPLRPFTFQV